MPVESLGQALLEAGILDATSVEVRVPRARTAIQFMENLVRDGIVTENTLVSQLARALSVPRYDPKERSPEPEAVALLDRRSCEELGAVPVALRGGGGLLWVAVCDPTDEALVTELSRRSGRRVKPCLIGPRELQRALQQTAFAAPAPGGPHPGAPPPHPPGPMPSAPSAAPYPSGYPAPYRMPMPGSVPGVPPLPYAAMSNGGGMGLAAGMPGQPYPSGFPYGAMPQPMPQPLPIPQAMPQQVTLPPMPQQVTMPPGAQPPAHAPPDRGPEIQRLEEELAQARQVVKILAQMLVERGVIDGEDLKRRLRTERDRKS